MGTFTLADFHDELVGVLGRPSLSTTKTYRYVNLSYKEIAYALKFAELQAIGSFPTVSGTQSYDLATAAADFRMLNEEGLRKTAPSDRLGRLIKETRTQYLRALGDSSNSETYGTPRWYHRFGKSTVYFRPIPDDTIVTVEFDYWKKVTTLANPADVTLLSEDWDAAILAGAIAWGFRGQGEQDKYVNARNDFLGLVRSRALEDDVEEFPQGILNLTFDGMSAVESDSGDGT